MASLGTPVYEQNPDGQFQVESSDETPMANLMLSVLGAVAQFERDSIRERQRVGIALAKQRGAYTGRKKALIPERVQELCDSRWQWRNESRSCSGIRDKPREPLSILAPKRRTEGCRPPERQR
jgi:hypothetical protein